MSFSVLDAAGNLKNIGAPSGGGGAASLSRVVLAGATLTLANRESMALIDYFAIEGTGVLVLVGDAAIGVL